jgi:hypothetical protein
MSSAEAKMLLEEGQRHSGDKHIFLNSESEDMRSEKEDMGS